MKTDEKLQLLRDQGNVCALCNDLIPTGKRLYYDSIRHAITCTRCQIVIGHCRALRRRNDVALERLDGWLEEEL